jgi:hypothetical protein
MSNIALIQGESKYLPFLLKSVQTGRPLPLTGATFLMHIKQNESDLIPVISKGDADFIKSYADVGKVSVLLTLRTPVGSLDLSRSCGSKRPACLLIYKIPFEFEVEAQACLMAC